MSVLICGNCGETYVDDHVHICYLGEEQTCWKCNGTGRIEQPQGNSQDDTTPTVSGNKADNLKETAMNEEQIKHMVNRFLGWKLPENFSPDAGISFVPEYPGMTGPMKHNPSGTNLFDATQATEMVRYITEGIDMLATDPQSQVGSHSDAPTAASTSNLDELISNFVTDLPIKATEIGWERIGEQSQDLEAVIKAHYLKELEAKAETFPVDEKDDLHIMAIPLSKVGRIFT